MKDQYGRSIRLRDVVTYPVRQGSDMWMVNGIVYDVQPNRIGVYVVTQDEDGRKRRTKTSVERTDRVTIIHWNLLTLEERRILLTGAEINAE